ncbi:hypothetical protein BTN49_2490 [Candidatus Enterovibrio escicola]|uniref:Uncharacterized protein n=1 Tax=Candidatus Enterovibrio escicola TaxID=1927127 RepID=A0A2A5T1I1_9GAMM|nr:hypothetical protein BTN49_2490 [Candidatus Enterovibrio escacola]
MANAHHGSSEMVTDTDFPLPTFICASAFSMLRYNIGIRW